MPVNQSSQSRDVKLEVGLHGSGSEKFVWSFAHIKV